MRKLIGLSISRCMVDLVLRQVPLSRVEKIIARTAFRNERQLELVLIHYARWEWRSDFFFMPGFDIPRPEASEKMFKCRIEYAKALTRRFYREGRIEQPRLTERRYPAISFPERAHWVFNESQIVWEADRHELPPAWVPEEDWSDLANRTWDEVNERRFKEMDERHKGNRPHL